MSSEEIAAAEDAVRGLLGDDVAELLRPVLRPEHVPVVEMLERLAWSVGPMEVIADEAIKILAESTTPGGLIDPKDDDADVPWAVILNKMLAAPRVGSRSARTWYAHGMRLLWADAEVSAIYMSTASYHVAALADLLGREHDVARWMMTAAIESEHDARSGVVLAAVVRAARLLTGAWASR